MYRAVWEQKSRSTAQDSWADRRVIKVMLRHTQVVGGELMPFALRIDQ